MSDVETPKGETKGAQDHGTVSTDAATQGTEQSAESTELAAMKADLETERKARQQAEMRANQLKNKQDELERTRLEEDGKWKEAYELEKQRAGELEADKEAQAAANRAKAFREAQIDAYDDPKVQIAARKLVAKNPANLSWTDGADETEAATQLKDQLDTLAETISGTSNFESDTASALNHNPRSVAPPKPQESAEQRMDRLHKEALKSAGY